MVGRALEGADCESEPGEVTVDVERHLLLVVTAGVGPAGEESPLLIDGLPVQTHGRDGGTVHVVEMRAVGTVLRDDLRMHGFALGAARKLRVGAVIRVLGGW